jgi:hypothetical protein
MPNRHFCRSRLGNPELPFVTLNAVFDHWEFVENWFSRECFADMEHLHGSSAKAAQQNCQVVKKLHLIGGFTNSNIRVPLNGHLQFREHFRCRKPATNRLEHAPRVHLPTPVQYPLDLSGESLPPDLIAPCALADKLLQLCRFLHSAGKKKTPIKARQTIDTGLFE